MRVLALAPSLPLPPCFCKFRRAAWTAKTQLRKLLGLRIGRLSHFWCEYSNMMMIRLNLLVHSGNSGADGQRILLL
jgi:hypothetical protein